MKMKTTIDLRLNPSKTVQKDETLLFTEEQYDKLDHSKYKGIRIAIVPLWLVDCLNSGMFNSHLTEKGLEEVYKILKKRLIK